jgi:hypothetical protein
MQRANQQAMARLLAGPFHGLITIKFWEIDGKISG